MVPSYRLESYSDSRISSLARARARIAVRRSSTRTGAQGAETLGDLDDAPANGPYELTVVGPADSDGQRQGPSATPDTLPSISTTASSGIRIPTVTTLALKGRGDQLQ